MKKHFSYTRTEGKYCLYIKLLSHRTPFEYLYELERDVAKRIQDGLVLIDESEHNDSEEKRYISVEVKRGKLRMHTLAFAPDYEPEFNNN